MSFVAATLVIVVTPGPGVALASSQAVKHGMRAALYTVFGDVIGTVVHIAIAVISLNAILNVAAAILPFLQMAGGLFILYLAYHSFRAPADASVSPRLSPSRSAFLSGFFGCVTNPKAIVFFIALFPGFISPDFSIGVQTLVYGSIFILLDAAFISAYAMLAMHVVNSTLAPKFDIDKISGFGLLGVGALLIVKGYKEIPAS